MKAINADSRLKGSITLEAALVLPVLLCAFFSVVFIIKAVYSYTLIQHALDETASEIASAGYIYHVSGIRDIHDTARDGINSKAELFRGQIGSVFDTYKSLKNMVNPTEQGLPGVGDSIDLLADAEQSFNNMLEQAEGVSDPLEELKSIACYVASGAFKDAKTQLFLPVVRLNMKRYLVTEKTGDADTRLKALNIAGGMEGLDFSESSFLADESEEIDIIVRYQVRLPLPDQFGTGGVMEFFQRAKAKAWLGGDQAGSRHDEEATDSIWSLSNFQRGLKIRRLFEANLPVSFPVIARYETGRAVMIKSMDLTADSYQTGDNAKKTLTGYLKELSAFKGQDTPWGSSGVVVRGNDITSRELLLVIPQNKLSEANERLLAEMSSYASAKGIELVVKRYGMKTSAADEDNGGETDASAAETGNDED